MSETPQATVQTGCLPDESLNRLFYGARTHSVWLDERVTNETLLVLYDLLRMGPTSANSCPARFVFLTTTESRERLVPALSPKNVEKTRKAPVTVIVAWDTEFYEKFSELTPSVDWKSVFAGNQNLIDSTVLRNSSLQGAYLILAARALGLDCGPMSGFDAEKVNAEFFPDGRWKVNFLCNLGHGDPTELKPRNPRLSFDDACLVL